MVHQEQKPAASVRRTITDRFRRDASAQGRLRGSLTLIDWLTTGVVIAVGHRHRQGDWSFRHEYHQWPEDSHPQTDPDLAAAWLRDLCGRSGVSLRSVVASIPRREISLRLLTFPDVSEAELQDLADLQVESRSLAAGQALRWDLLLLPQREQFSPGTDPENTHQPTPPERRATLITVPESVCAMIETVLRKAGTETLRLTSGDLLIHTAVESRFPDARSEAAALHILSNPQKTELVICSQHVPVAAGTMGTQAGDPDGMATAIESATLRMMATLPDSLKRPDLRGSIPVWISGTEATSLSDVMRQRGLAAHVVDPDERIPRLAAMAAAEMSPRRIDFLKSQFAEVRTRARRRRLRAIAATVALSVAGLGWTGMAWYDSLEQMRAELLRRHADLQAIAERGRSVLDQQEFLKRWERSSVNTSQEILLLTELLPPADRMIVTRLQLDAPADAQDKVMRIDGVARSAEDILQLNSRLLQSPEHYQLRPSGIEPAPAGSEMSAQFRVEAGLILHQADPSVI